MLDSSKLEDYLQAFVQKPNALARLVAQPDEAAGIVHTPREIAGQPLLWRATARKMQQSASELKRRLEVFGLGSSVHQPSVICVGAGSSDYVGMSIVDLLRTRLKTECQCWPTTRVTACPETFLTDDDRRYVILHFARSGNSPESVATMRLALERLGDRAFHVVITCNDGGELAMSARNNADRVALIVLPPEANDAGLAMTASFTSMVVAGQAIAYLDALDEFVQRNDRVADAAETFMQTHADEVAELASLDLRRVFYLGNNDLLGAATESALKVQELTAGKIIARGEDTMAFRHGPISAVDSRSLVCFFLSEDDHTRRYETDVLHQFQDAFRTMGTTIVVIASERVGESFSEHVRVLSYRCGDARTVAPLHQVNAAVVFGQMFAAFAACQRGVHLDDPSSQHPLYSRTVRGVQIHPVSTTPSTSEQHESLSSR